MQKIIVLPDTNPMIKSKVICSECGHVSDNVEVKTVDIYFPFRRLRNSDGIAICCEGCGFNGDLTIFGEQHVSSMRKPEVLLLPMVKENNRIHNTRSMIDLLRDAIRYKSKITILKVYEMVERESFSWDGLDDLFEEWNKLVDKANDICYS